MNYFEHPAISNTKLGWFKKAPAYYKFCQEKKEADVDSQAFIVGGASHCVLFEPDKFKSVFHVLDESKRPEPDMTFGAKKNKIWLEEQYEAYAHKKIITLDKYDEVMYMMEALKKHTLVQELLAGCEFEKEHYWEQEIQDDKGITHFIKCKKKVDGEKSTLRLDYKTADNADPFVWPNKAWSYGYYRQAGFYDLSAPKEFWFIVQEKSAPYLISVHKCSQQLLNYGKDEALKLLREIRAHQEHDLWPGYEMRQFEQDYEYFDFEIPGWVISKMT